MLVSVGSFRRRPERPEGSRGNRQKQSAVCLRVRQSKGTAGGGPLGGGALPTLPAEGRLHEEASVPQERDEPEGGCASLKARGLLHTSRVGAEPGRDSVRTGGPSDREDWHLDQTPWKSFTAFTKQRVQNQDPQRTKRPIYVTCAAGQTGARPVTESVTFCKGPGSKYFRLCGPRGTKTPCR